MKTLVFQYYRGEMQSDKQAVTAPALDKVHFMVPKDYKV
jgi:hypothetical protein